MSFPNLKKTKQSSFNNTNRRTLEQIVIADNKFVETYLIEQVRWCLDALMNLEETEKSLLSNVVIIDESETKMKFFIRQTFFTMTKQIALSEKMESLRKKLKVMEDEYRQLNKDYTRKLHLEYEARYQL